jgi:hypothetical protein
LADDLLQQNCFEGEKNTLAMLAAILIGSLAAGVHGISRHHWIHSH